MKKWFRNKLYIASLLGCFVFICTPLIDQCDAGMGKRGGGYQNSSTSGKRGGGQTSSTVPEPSTILLLAAGGAAVYVIRRWAKK